MKPGKTKVLLGKGTSTDELLSLAKGSLESGDFEIAVLEFSKILKGEPNNVDARFGLADAYFGLADYDNAEGAYRLGLGTSPEHADGLFGLAATLRVIESYEDSIQVYERGFDQEPDRTAAYWELAYAREMMGDIIGAERAYKKCLSDYPDHGMAKHLLAAMLGTNTARAPDDYVRDLFDDYADSFEHDLLNDLNYVVPDLICDELKNIAKSTNILNTAYFTSALDLGCGTGLVSKDLRGIVAEIDGVDISRNMIEVARKKQRYDNLYIKEMTAFLQDTKIGKPVYDLIVSGDALVYFGDLRSVFRGVSKRLSCNGIFCFSLENLNSGSFNLCPTGRYAHSNSYITDLSNEIGFKVLVAKNIIPRIDDSQNIRGCLYLLSSNGRN